MVAKAVEAYAQSSGHPGVSAELMAQIRQQMGTRFQPQG